MRRGRGPVARPEELGFEARSRKIAAAIYVGRHSFSYSRILFTYAAFKNHVGLYPTPGPLTHFKKELAKYTTGKGSVQFPLDKPLPKGLITKMAKYRVKEAKEKDVRWM